MNLICDAREKNVIPIFPKHDWIKVETLAVGDYVIKTDESVFFIFERKTWSDLAASLKDGRIESQMKKMMSLTCPRFLLIEGKMSYPPDHLIQGIEFYKLDAFRRKAMMIGLPVVQTKNEYHTVEFLVAFTEQFAKEQEKLVVKSAGNEVLERKKATVPEQVDVIWKSIPGVGATALPVLRKYSLRQIFKMTVREIAAIKYLSGRCLGESTALKILSPLSDKKKAADVLAAVNGISDKMAKYILTQVEFNDFINGNMDVKVSDKKNLGPTMQDRVHELFSYK